MASTTRSDRIHVLHVDDDRSLAELVGASLTRVNDDLRVTTVATVDEALTRLDDRTFDCVVSDYDMPDRNGIEFLRTVRTSTTQPRVPFILYTGKGSEEVASDAITAGASDYMQKESGLDHYRVLANRIVTLVERERAEAAVNDVQRLFSELADRTTDVLWMFTADWNEVVFVNDAYEEVFEHSRSCLEADPETFLDSVQPSDHEQLTNAMAGLSEGISVDIEVSVVTEDGGLRDVWIKGEPITDDAGTVTHVGGFTRDVTERKTRERELASVERQYRAVFEDPNILTGVLAPDGTVLDVNQTAMEYIDGDIDDVLGEQFSATPWWGDNDALRADVDDWVARAAAGEYVEFEADITGQDGGRTVSGVFRPVRDDDGTVTALIVSDRDITERTERERELERYEAYLERSTDIITVLNADGTVKYQSPSLTRILGYESGELIGQDGFELVHPDDRPELYETFLELVERPDESVTVEARFRTADDEWRLLEVRGRNHLDHPVIAGVVTNNRDITERKHHERELERQNEQLEQFAGVVSHDLRNPLSVADGYLTLARETQDSDALAEVARAHERMNDLIEDLLALARRGDGVQTETALDLATVAEDAWQHVPTESATLDIATTGTVYADRAILQQLLENLFRNATEHGGDTITIALHENGFTVADDGPGIPEPDRERVFETGYSTRSSGTGLGLAIVAQCAEAHDWTIRATQSPDGGAQFDLTNVQVER
ncbi:PAS domain S-box protein [Salarchaeum japonicum]|uniref:PAS domain S-box protein n=1 Tax=Salarchaeum japonicum TaxID=555573 RepID=UPI003C76AB9D